jgi:hypothetical protein
MGRRVPRPPVNSGNKAYCTRSETFSVAAIAGTVMSFRDLALDKLTTCQDLAQFFQLFRITGVQMRFKPNVDSIVPAQGQIKPYLYWQIDRSATIPNNIDATYFEDLGCKPTVVDEKPIIRSYRPSVLTANPNGVAGVQTGGYKLSPWLPTNMDSVDEDPTGFTVSSVEHHGCLFYISKTAQNDAQYYDIDVTVTVQFWKPLVVPAPGAGPAVKVTYAKGDLATDMSGNRINVARDLSGNLLA